MKMIWIFYNIGIDEEITNTLNALNIHFYTKFPRVIGVGELTGARLDNHVWPGANNALLVVLPEDQAAHLMNVLEKLRATIGKHEGLYAFQAGLERVTANPPDTQTHEPA